MNAQVFRLRSLVIFLDEARMIYHDTVRKVTRPDRKQWFERIIHTQPTIAHDLAGKIDRMGRSVARDGICVTALCLRWAAWWVRISRGAQASYALEAG